MTKNEQAQEPCTYMEDEIGRCQYIEGHEGPHRFYMGYGHAGHNPNARQEAHETQEHEDGGGIRCIHCGAHANQWAEVRCIERAIPVTHGEPTKTFQLLDSIEQSLAHETRWERLRGSIPDDSFYHSADLFDLMNAIEQAIPVASTEANDDA